MRQRIVLTIRSVRLLLHVVRGVTTTAVILPWSSRKLRDRLIQNWAADLMRLLRVTVRIRGTLPERHHFPVVLTANHISWVDIFAIHSVYPVRFVSKSEVRHWPVFGWLAAKTGTLFLVRSSRKQTAAIGQEMEDVLATGDSLGLFPESTTSEGMTVLPFRTSLLQAAINRETVLLPVALRYRLEDERHNPHIPFIGEMTFARSLARVLSSPPSLVEIRIGAIVTPNGRHRRDLALHLEQITASLLSDASLPHHDANVFRREPETGHGLPDAPP
ncbi:MAG: 1-acyl-sn-glycerol-3-phosphate acyltransferase [Betaproteobacteria bacterium]|nr:1-acyl-sn-glycerol-3-phosphate acyltransferase [Betaproteobacteria bacterium]MDE2623065.1 1-acyl-sn-glycerol-3-phosphate acyltransferase [Betaproteobacteria bacterium]